MLRSAIRINDILEATNCGPSWDGLRIKVLKIDDVYNNAVHGIVTQAVDSQPHYPVGTNITMLARRFSLYERKKPREIAVGDLVEVNSVGWQGVQYKVEEKNEYGFIRGPIVVTNRTKKFDYPIGTNVGFYHTTLMLVEDDGKAVKTKTKTIFAKEGGWGP